LVAFEHGLLICNPGDQKYNWVFNGEAIEECVNLSIIQVLNYLGNDGWEFAGSIGSNGYILKRNRNN
jgi:hypothetical protein